MKAVILAGGEGTRLRPITENVAKPFVRIDGKPCIDHVIEALVRDGFTDILMTMYYKPEDMIDHLGSGMKFGANIVYSIEDTPLGTFGGVGKNSSFLNDTVVVASGDVLADVDFIEIYNYHKKVNAIATIALTTTDNPTEYGIVGLDSNGRINRFKEKPPLEEVFSDQINAGIYVLEPQVFDLFPKNQKADFAKTIFPTLLKMNKPLYGKRLSGLWIDIGRPSDLVTAHLMTFSKRFRSKIRVTSGNMEKVNIRGRCYVGRGVHLGHGVYLENAYIYDVCSIGEGVKIVNSVISSETRIGDDTVIEDSFVCDSCNIGEEVLLDNTVLGRNVTVENGRDLSNRKVDGNTTV